MSQAMRSVNTNVSLPVNMSVSHQVWWLIGAMSYKWVFGAKTRKGATRKPAKWWLFRVFAWDFSPRHTKVRHFPCVAFSPTVRRTFAWRGERSPRKNPPKSQFAGFRVATFRLLNSLVHCAQNILSQGELLKAADLQNVLENQ